MTKSVGYSARSIILTGEQQRELACAAIRNAPEGVECLLREPVKARGLDQNGLYFLRVGEIADQAWFGNPRQQFGKDTWHIYLRMNVMAEEITTKDGEKRSKWEEVPDGDAVVISTTKLERRCFAEYTTAVEAFGASLGVQFSANPNEGRR